MCILVSEIDREREREREEERVGNKRESDNLESKTYRKRTSNPIISECQNFQVYQVGETCWNRLCQLIV